MEFYRHTQTGTLIMLLTVLAAVGIVVAVYIDPSSAATMLPVAALILVSGWMFGKLTVAVDDNSLQVAFGPGFIKRRVPLTEIRGASSIRTSIINGWGIRRVPGGWLWNVSGLDAVELRLTSGSRFLVGSDQPERLVEAINQAQSLRTAGKVDSAIDR